MLRTPTLDWYFDVISPFAYLQFQRLREVEARAQVRRVPVLFAGLLEHWGQKGPAEIVPKLPVSPSSLRIVIRVTFSPLA